MLRGANAVLHRDLTPTVCVCHQSVEFAHTPFPRRDALKNSP